MPLYQQYFDSYKENSNMRNSVGEPGIISKNIETSLQCNVAEGRNYLEGEGEVAFFSAKRWDRRNRADLIESATPCHDAKVVGPYRDSNPLRLIVLAAMPEDYTTAPQHLRRRVKETTESLVLLYHDKENKLILAYSVFEFKISVSNPCEKN